MKKLIPYIRCLIMLVGNIPGLLQAQQEARIYHWDGRIIHGQLKTPADADTIILAMVGESLIRLPQNRIDSIVLGPSRYKIKKKPYRPLRYYQRGVYHRLSLFAIAFKQSEFTFIDETFQGNSVSYHIGYRIFPQLAIGIGGGRDVFLFISSLLGITGELSGNLVQNRNDIAYSVRAGWSWPTGPRSNFYYHRGGFKTMFMLGWHRRNKGRISPRFLAGYFFQKMDLRASFISLGSLDPVLFNGWFNGFMYGIEFEFGGKYVTPIRRI